MKKVTKTQNMIGWIMGGFFIAFMLFDAVIKFLKLPMVIETTVNDLGYQEHHILIMGGLCFSCLVLYIFPRTSVLGAILFTAYLGGAIATNLRLDKPLLSHTLFPIYTAILMWGSLWLRRPELRDIFPIIKK